MLRNMRKNGKKDENQGNLKKKNKKEGGKGGKREM